MSATRTLHICLALALLLAAGFLLFWKLGGTSFVDGDEAIYSECAREMIERADYMSVHFAGKPYLLKPPGKMWLVALGFKLFGVNEFGARFSAALLAVGSVALTFLLGRLLFGTTAGLLAGAILLSSSQFLHEHCGRIAVCESETLFFSILSVICAWQVGRDRRWLYGLMGSLGLLAMIKGPVFLPFAGIAVLHLVISGTWRKIGLRTGTLGILLFLAITLPWHIHQLMTHGDLMKRWYFGTQIYCRFTGEAPPRELLRKVAGVSEEQRLWFYPLVVFYSLFPWSLVAIPALASLFRNILRRAASAERLLILWIAVFGFAVTLSKGKLPHYIIPILPAVAIASSEFCHRLYRSKSQLLFIVTVVTALLISFLFVPAPDYSPYPRVTAKWPIREPNIVPLWALEGPAVLSLIPILVGCGLLIAAVSYGFLHAQRAGPDGKLRRLFWIVFLGSFLFSGLWQAVLPYRNAEHRREVAKCLDAVRAAGLEPDRALLLGSETTRLRDVGKYYFYLYDLAGGKNGEILARASISRAMTDSTLYRSGTLILFMDTRFDEQVSGLENTTQVWKGPEISAYYVHGP